MADPDAIRYARSGDVAIAYAVSGAEPHDLVFVSTVNDLVAGSGLQFEERGGAELKGVAGLWQLFAVRPDAGEGLAA